jgi:hypothetical protein
VIARPTTRLLAFTAAVTAAAALAGCGGETPAPDDAATAEPLRRAVEEGPIAVAITVDPPAIEVGQPVSLTIDVTAERGTIVEMPAFAEEVGAFERVTVKTPPDIPEGPRRRWRHVHTLTTYEPGAHDLPAVDVRYTALGASAVETVTIDPVTVTVSSVLGPDEAQAVPALHDALDVPLPRPWGIWLAVSGVAYVVLVAAILAVILLVLRRGRAPATPPVPIHVWALHELERLAGLDLLDRGETALYYERLSTIVRWYVERRYDIMANERTTDEFLRDAQGHPALDDGDRAELGVFLRSADMAKFARYEPPRRDSEQALVAAQTFVERTAPRTGNVDVAPAPGREVAA